MNLITLPLLLTYLVVELTLPMLKRWSMKWRNLLPDVFYIMLSSATAGLLSAILALASITHSGQADGPARDWPLWLQVAGNILDLRVYELQHPPRYAPTAGADRAGAMAYSCGASSATRSVSVNARGLASVQRDFHSGPGDHPADLADGRDRATLRERSPGSSPTSGLAGWQTLS